MSDKAPTGWLVTYYGHVHYFPTLKALATWTDTRPESSNPIPLRTISDRDEAVREAAEAAAVELDASAREYREEMADLRGEARIVLKAGAEAYTQAAKLIRSLAPKEKP